ncbi:MAG: hypothetical protein ACO1OO_03925 [Flavisolibacter sp.]
MKKVMLGLIAFSVAGIFAACNNDAQTSENTDSTTVTTTSTGDYAAMADEFDRNSEAGKYVDVHTGKPIKISVDRTTGKKVNAETKEPVTRYIMIDGPEWWVYDIDGNRLGQAKLDNGTVLFDDNGNWVDYDTKWKDDGDESKYKSDDMKVKTDEDGMKIKTDDQKIKVDEDGTKVKDN